ncbi:MAG: hypothetical protein U1E45_10005 [Geminicoccaceae bacterium]
MLAAIAAFASVLVNPLAALLAVWAGFWLPRRMLARSAGAVVGMVFTAPELAGDLEMWERPLAALGGAAAGLLQVEVVLHFLVPGWDIAQRILRAIQRRLGSRPPSSPAS